MFSILIPSWNNLAYLQLCIDAIRRHSSVEHEIIVFVNDGSDGTLDWVRAQGLPHVHAPANIGVCLSVNLLAAQATRPWLVYLNDDMVCAPGWDSAFAAEIAGADDDLMLLSSTLIEPAATGNTLVLVDDFGRTAETFDAARFARDHARLPAVDRWGRASQPTVISRRWWHAVGGYSIEFGPGMSSDDDLLMKLWVTGCRRYKVLGDSRVYHFACRSTGRVRRNKGARTFAMKWGITQGEFKRRFLQLSDPAANTEPGLPTSTAAGRAKRIAYALGGDFPLGDLGAWDPAPGRHVLAAATPTPGGGQA